MSYKIDPGTVYVGYMIAEKFGLKEADILEIEGKTLKVVRCLMEQGDVDDVRIQCHLRDAQDILKLAGQISQIQAVDCLCFAAADNLVSVLRKQITSLLPDTKVFQVKTIAMARAQQRQMVRNVFAVITPFVVVACGVWIGVLAMTNVRDRQAEIGIMRALGYGWSRIMLLFLGKAVMIGLLGAVLGFIAGTAVAMDFGPDVFRITAKAIKPQYLWLVWSLIAAPLFAAVSSFIPAMIAVALDPAVTLRQE
jgi:putative ABC transport system permease protein